MSEPPVATTSQQEERDRIAILDSKIAAAEATIAAETKMRVSSRIIELSAIGALLLLWIVSRNAYIPLIPNKYIDSVYFPVIEIAVVFGVILFLIREGRFRMGIAREDADSELLRARKRLLEQLPTSAEGGRRTKDYFDALVRINVDNLAGYYSLVKIHTDKSFIVALAMGVAGFVLLALGIVVGFTNSARAELMTYISSAAGVVTEFIASVFFYLYNRTIRQMKDYHDSLLSVQNILLALKLVDDTEQSSDRIKMIGQMLAYLLTKRAAVEPAEVQPLKPLVEAIQGPREEATQVKRAAA